MANETPLILVTNDDGIHSHGLRAAARAAMSLGQALVVAPCEQWSGAGRSFPRDSTGAIGTHRLTVGQETIDAFCVDASPAQVVLHALLKLAPRRPDLIVVGINYGENLGADITISGTVGAALQGATFHIPALAVSLQTPKETHANPSDDVDFSTAIHFTRYFSQRLLAARLPFDADVLKIDVPCDATPETPWRLTRVSRQTYYYAVLPHHQAGPMDYRPRDDTDALEHDSDIYAFVVDRVVSVSPLSIDLTTRADPEEVAQVLQHAPAT
ncbi:MAG: 5'/3'-nucleotidase SurE [Anaerolineae bacterium]|nr:5'/3'-nucleotidase SurE [Anaerolineae bacterium]